MPQRIDPHDFLDFAYNWLPVMETGRFSRYHVIAPSLRGHGRSDWIGPGATYYFLDYVADVHSLVEWAMVGIPNTTAKAAIAI